MHSSNAGDFRDFSLFRELSDWLASLDADGVSCIRVNWEIEVEKKSVLSLILFVQQKQQQLLKKNKNWPTRKKTGENPSVSVNVYFCLQLASIAAKVHLFGDWRSHFGEDRQSSATVALCRQSDSLPLHPSSTVLLFCSVLSPTELPLSLCMHTHTHTHTLTDSLNCTDSHLHNCRCTEERERERKKEHANERARVRLPLSVSWLVGISLCYFVFPLSLICSLWTLS